MKWRRVVREIKKVAQNQDDFAYAENHVCHGRRKRKVFYFPHFLKVA
jgi:hypothetical protein